MEEEETQDAETARMMEEIRQRRLAYFESAQVGQEQTATKFSETNADKHGTSKKAAEKSKNPLKNEKLKASVKTAEFHIKARTGKEESYKRINSRSEEYISYTSSKAVPGKHPPDNADQPRSRRRSSASSVSDDEIGPLVSSSRTKSKEGVKPSVSGNTPQYSKSRNADIVRGRWISNEDVRQCDGERGHRLVRNSGDSEVENLFSNRKWVSANEIPALCLKESADVDAVSVFKSSANFDDLGLSTHRPESTTSGGIIDFADKTKLRQRSVSSESLLLGSKAEEMRNLLGEQKYKEFVEKSKYELNQLHKTIDAASSSVYSDGPGQPERPSRRDGPGTRNTPTPPPQPPSPQPTGSSRRGPSPRRRLRSSSPQLVSKTLQDIARVRETREGSGSSRNYEQVVVPHNTTFSADEIYRQAYGEGGSSNNDLHKSTSSAGSSYQDPNAPFWNAITPRQMAGSMSPSSPHGAPLFQTPFMPMSSGVPIHPPPPSRQQQQPLYAGSPNSARSYVYPPGGLPMNMVGGGPFMYPGQQNMFMSMSPGTPPQSPDSSLYHMHPLSQSMPGFHAPNGPQYNPAGMPWQYAQHGPELGKTVPGPGQHPHGYGQHPQGHGQHPQGHGQYGQPWNQFGHGGEGSHYSQNWQENPGHFQMPHPPSKVTDKSGDDRADGRSAAHHVDAVRQHHEQRRQIQEKQAHVNNNQPPNSFSASSLDRYFSSLRMPPPNYPPPPYHVHQPPPSQHVPQQRQPGSDRHPANVQQSADSYVDDDLTMVTRTSMTTNTSIKAGGITDRMEQLGVDPQILNNLKQRTETLAADEEALDAMRNLVRICPECNSVNKEYMTWCLQCGGVLIGVDPIPAKDRKKKNKEKRGADILSKTRKSQSLSDVSRVQVPVEVQHYDIQEPFLEYEERIEEEIIYDTKDCAHEASEAEPAPQISSPLEDSYLEEHTGEVTGTKESPESGRGASATSSPLRRNISQEFSEDARDLSQNNLEVVENKDSGRPSSGEGAESRKPQLSSQLIPDDGPRRSEKEINDICGVINDPIIRGFIKNYLQKTPQEQMADLAFNKPTSNQQGNAERKQSDRLAGDQKPLSKSRLSEPEVKVNSSKSNPAVSKTPASGKKGESPKKKMQRKNSKKGHEAIDVEIFAIEEAKLCRSARSGTNIVPILNLVHTSDEEDDSSEKTSSLQGVPNASSDTSSSKDDFAPVNYSDEVKVMAAKVSTVEERENIVHQSRDLEVEHGHVQVNQELANSNFQFLQHLVESRQPASPSQHKKPAQTRPQPQRRPSPTSKVRASVDAPPPNRRWMRSSIAWSSYHPRELRTRSSINLQQGPPSKTGRQSQGSVKASQSTDNLMDRNPPEMAPSQRPRPASADLYNRRGANSRGRPTSAGRGGRPSSAGHFSRPQARLQMEVARSAGMGDHLMEQQRPDTEQNNNSAPSPRSPNTDIEGRPIHRLPVLENTLPLIPAGPTTALKIYDRYFDLTPRDDFEQRSKWLFLPEELWLHVFTYLLPVDLFHVSLSCKQLYSIALDPVLWKRVTVRKKWMRNEWLDEIAKRHPVSLAMVQCYGEKVSENALRELFKEIAPKLKELNFSRCSKGKLIGDEILLYASTHCRHLTHVDASWCHVTDVGLTALASCCHRLQSLCLNGCQMITDESLKAVLDKHGTSLRVLELFGCFSLSPASFRYLGQQCPSLLTLSMAQCYKISDTVLEIMSTNLGHLETLDLRGCKKLGDNSIKRVVRNCQQLRHLTLANCPELSNASVTEIATYARNIRSLDVCGCSKISDPGIQTLAANCNRLTSIDISSTSCTHRSVLTLAESSPNLECAKFNFLADVHEQSLSRLIRNCKRLNTVHLYGCNVRNGTELKRHNRFLNIEM